MKALDPLEYEEAINEYVDKLQTIDPTRLAYYKDLSKFDKKNIGTNETLKILYYHIKNFNFLAKPCSCAGWLKLCLVANP